MNVEGMDGEWRQSVEEATAGMRDWRGTHPRANLREIEAALDEGLGRLRARMLEDAAVAGDLAEWGGDAEEGPRCPDCKQALQRRGCQERGVRVQGGQDVRLRRCCGVCPGCGAGFSPLAAAP